MSNGHYNPWLSWCGIDGRTAPFVGFIPIRHILCYALSRANLLG